MRFLVAETLHYSVEAEDGTVAISARKRGEGAIVPNLSAYRASPWNSTPNQLLPETPTNGVGTELKTLIAQFGFHAPNCKCSQHIREMNQNGIEWCQQNIDTIVGWLKEEARRAGLPFIESAAKIMIRRAITNAKKALLTSAPK